MLRLCVDCGSVNSHPQRIEDPRLTDADRIRLSELRLTVDVAKSPNNIYSSLLTITVAGKNKSAQSNLGRGPRRGTVAHVRRKVPVCYNGAPQIRPQKYPFSWTDAQTHYLPHSWTRFAYDAKRHPDPIRHFSTMHWTDRRADARTDRQTDRSSTGKFDHYIGRCASNESDAA